MNIKNKIFNNSNKMLLGVCFALSKHFDCSVNTFRIIFIVATIIDYRFAIINYLALFLLMDNDNI
ncbi:phage shock protein C (PspC) family protein [Clostridium sp. DSM 8431]|uniref:PspC domain-containing protein n=1 Tax=Clostridium sp. DSM 8431 TaxID=1761781 RepID=UPI0008EB314D|nr:PspC domain-containing protein [Clostridium sp. DSM 8431]SFU73293.1 phage shock protein C (PspC) family protein [Clostridium sp. DSM 8431]